MMNKQSRHAHVDQVFNYDDLSCSCLGTRSRSQVVHNRGHGFSKRLNPAGVYQLSIIDVARTPISLSCYHHRQPFYDLVPRDPERQAPLTNNAQIRVAPGESTPNPKAGRALGSDSSVSTGFGLPGHHIWGRALAGQGWTNRETMSPLACIG